MFFDHLFLFLFLADPSATPFLLHEYSGFRTFTFIRKHVFCINFYIGNHVILVMFCNGFFMKIHMFYVFLSIDFWHRFFIMFLTEKGFQKDLKISMGRGPFFKLFRKSIFGEDTLAPFWLHWAPLWLPLDAFCLPLPPFWLPFDHFGLPFCSLGSKFAPKS